MEIPQAKVTGGWTNIVGKYLHLSLLLLLWGHGLQAAGHRVTAQMGLWSYLTCYTKYFSPEDSIILTRGINVTGMTRAHTPRAQNESQ